MSFFHDPEHIWIAMSAAFLGALLVASLATLVFAYVVRTLLSDFLARQQAILTQALYDSDSAQTAFTAMNGRIDTVNGHLKNHDSTLAEVQAGQVDHENRIKRLEGKRLT